MLWRVALVVTLCQAAPLSKPYIAFRTDPLDQDGRTHHELSWDTTHAVGSATHSTVVPYDNVDTKSCPLQFSVGLAKRLHYHADHDQSSRIVAPTVLSTVFAARGPGKQVIYATAYEHVDLLSPAHLEHSSSVLKEALVQASTFPLLFESSSFVTSPILHDVNGDGIMDIIVSDYDGGISIVGTSSSRATDGTTMARYFHHTQVPRLYVRRSWIHDVVTAAAKAHGIDVPAGVETNTTNKGPSDPFHSYFEYYYSGTNDALMRGVSANVLGQDTEHVTTLSERRHSKQQEAKVTAQTAAESRRLVELDNLATEMVHRRLQEGDHDSNQHAQTNQHEAAAAEANPQGHEQAADKDHQHGERPNEESNQQPEQRDERPNEESNQHPEQHDERPNEESKQQPEQQDERPNDANSIHGDGNPNQRQEPENQRQEPDETRGDPIGEANHERRDAYGGEEPQDDVNYRGDDQSLVDDVQIPEAQAVLDDDVPPPGGRSERNDRDGTITDVDRMQTGDDLAQDRYYGMMDDYQHRLRTGSYDDQYSAHHNNYYDSVNYIRIPPHILTTPVLVEVPKLYGNANGHEKDDMLLVAVSYYLDEDEYEGLSSYKRFQMTDQGDETEASRGGYVASAIMGYFLGDSSRWTGQTHLDLSTDFSAPENATMVGMLPVRMDLSKMAAFALSSPTVADLDGDGSPEVVIGTSMGLIYAFEARQMVKRERWPIQLKRPVEHRILVEDVLGNTNLEIFVSDIGGTIVCLDHQANIIWHRSLPDALGIEDGVRTEMSASSPMTMGDVDGDGALDLVQLVRINQQSYLFAIVAATGKDVPRFPIELDGTPTIDQKTFQIHHKFPQPLLVDLHADQSFLNDYLRRNGTAWTQRQPSTATKPLHGGGGPGLHIVQPHGDNLFIVEGYSGCTQKVSIGEEVSSMVQVDDVHATNKLDLVVATESGNIITLESQAAYHPLNTWTGGEVRGRGNLHAHGYSASQGIFVHQQSRQFVDVFGVYVSITFEIFDNRPNIQNEPDKRKYIVEIRDGPSWKRVLGRNTYTEPGVYTDRVYVRYGPGYYTLSVSMLTTHGIMYEDMFSIGYNVGFLDGFGVLLWLPLLVSAIVILLCGAKKTHWDDDDLDGNARDGQSLGILGRSLPT